MMVLVGGQLQGWFPLTGLPWNLPAVPYIFVGAPLTFDGTSSQALLLPMSSTILTHTPMKEVNVGRMDSD